MKLSEFNYHLPEELIAQEPLPKREQARLLVVDRARQLISHDIFKNVNRYLPERSLIILNDSKVVPARLLGRKERSGGKVEVFLLKRHRDGVHYDVLLRPLKKVREGDIILFNNNSLKAEIYDIKNLRVKFNRKGISQKLNKLGHMPLPPYIKREDRAEDRKYYQTVYAKTPGSVASPTAGLHFTRLLLRGLERTGHTVDYVTLHVNYATFKPVAEADVTKHKMHKEEYFLVKRTAERISRAKKNGQRIVAVGTTSCRVLETFARDKKLKGETDIFIYPGYDFRNVDVLITNFHQPFSTLLMLVEAFGGRPLIKKAYKEAIKEKYRFFSYGDAMMIL